jgi:hypothetical protein
MTADAAPAKENAIVLWSKRMMLPCIALLPACAAQPGTSELAATYDPTALQQIRDGARQVTVASAPVSHGTVVCREVKRTGSHMARERCVTRQQSRQESTEAKEWMRSGGQKGSVSVVQ